jgi:hypothetical protein
VHNLPVIIAVASLLALAVNTYRFRRANERLKEANAYIARADACDRPLSKSQIKEGLEIRLRQEMSAPVKEFTLIRSLRARIAELENQDA